MSKRGFGGSSGTYNVRASELARRRTGAATSVAASAALNKNVLPSTVAFLDETKHTFHLDKRAKGQVLMDLVFQHLELIEKDYFGLQFPESISSSDGAQWLDPVKSIRKQIKRGQPCLLYFRVKFYVSDPSKLQEEYTRYHFFLQLKKDIAEGRLYVPPNAAALLASYTVQSELGDYNADEHGHRYLADYLFVPNQTEEVVRKVVELHKLHRGQTPADAEFNYLDHAKRLDMYGVDLHPARVRDSTNAEIQLGVMSVGLVVFQNHIKINTFSWAKIVKISFKRKQFFIQLRRESHESYDSLLGFNMLGYRSCKNLWKSCVEHHTFFRLHVPRPTVKKYLFVFGSKFRYSGRTEYQTVEEGKRRARLEKSFVRSPSRRHGSRQTIPAITDEKRYAPLSAATMIASPVSVTATPPPPVPPSKPSLARLNGTGTHIRHYDSFNNRVVSSTSKEPRKAWTADGEQSDDEGGFLIPSREPPAAFAPLLPTRIGYVDDDDEGDQDAAAAAAAADDDDDELPPAYSVSEPDGRLLVTNGVGGDQESVVVICMTPDEQGKFGFNVKGGADQNMPIIVSRVAPKTPADRSIPRLSEGDQVLVINGRDVAHLAHDTVVQLIRNCCASATRELVLTVKPNVYVAEEVDEPPFRYVPDIPSSHVNAGHVPRTVDALTESMLLLGEGLDSGAVVAQFEQLYRKRPNMPMSVSRLPENVIKNRYRDISPYDSTRVVLRNTSVSSGDYINASYVQTEIPTSGVVNRYIATQGPLPNTVADFWLMVWEQQSTLIVMLTTVLERGRIKCHQYWPDLYQSHAYGPLRVTCTKDQAGPSFAFREFTLSNVETSEERHITHMQYIAWPDHGVPDDSSDFLEFVNKVRQNRSAMVESTIVHCSAGIGRTGVLILMETAMCLVEANEPVYPLDIVRNMRDQRAMLIQNASQYRFVCEAVLKVYNEKIVKPLAEFHR